MPDYAALAKANGAVSSAPPPSGSSVDYDALAKANGAASSTPTFRTSNAKDASGNAEVDPNTLGTFVKHLWDGVNPVSIGQMLPFPKVAGGSGVDNPLNPAKIVRDLHAVKLDADARLAKKDYVGALAKYVESVVPILGPMMSHQGDELQQGKYAAAAGDMTALAAQAAAPKIVPKAALALTDAVADTRASWANTRRTAQGAQSTLQIKQAIPASKSSPYTDAQFHQAMPYLDLEHAETPVTTVQGFRDAADTALKGIEDHIAGLVEANPTDTIKTNPLSAVKSRLSSSVRGSALTQGLKELDDLKLDQPLTVAEADRIRKQLNAENKAILKKNNYDVATARAADPGFAAREAAAASLRDGVYDALEARGATGVRALRQDEGAVIALRNAADRQIFAGEKVASGQQAAGPVRKAAAGLTRLASVGAGASVAGPAGAVVGSVAGEELANAILPSRLTRDALIEQGFSKRRPASAPYVPTLSTRPPQTRALPAVALPE